MMRIIQIVGYKNAGKTTLVCELVRQITARGLRVGTLKHDSHEFEPDVPNTDTWKHRQAGAALTAITSPTRTAWVEERPTLLEDLVSRFHEQSLDYLLIEGFKSAQYPKVVLLRGEQDIELLSLNNVRAVIVREHNDRLASEAAVHFIPILIQPSPLLTPSIMDQIL